MFKNKDCEQNSAIGFYYSSQRNIGATLLHNGDRTTSHAIISDYWRNTGRLNLSDRFTFEYISLPFLVNKWFVVSCVTEVSNLLAFAKAEVEVLLDEHECMVVGDYSAACLEMVIKYIEMVAEQNDDEGLKYNLLFYLRATAALHD